MGKAKEYIETYTSGLNTVTTLEDKIKHLISEYENPLIDIHAVAHLLSLIVEDLEGKG